MSNTTTEQLRAKVESIDWEESGTYMTLGGVDQIVALIQRENRAFAVGELEKLKTHSELLYEDFDGTEQHTFVGIDKIHQAIAALTGEIND